MGDCTRGRALTDVPEKTVLSKRGSERLDDAGEDIAHE